MDNLSAAIMFFVRLMGVYFFATALFAFKKRHDKPEPQSPKVRFAVLIPARNEAAVISSTVSTLYESHYPPELYDVFVVPNNCTDDTEAKASAAGAKIIHCLSPVRNKGDAMNQAISHLKGQGYDAICVFDADNIVDPMYLQHMNDAILGGARAAKGKLFCTNPYDTWVSGCYAIYFGLFNLFYNNARAALGLSAKLNGTGFAVTFELLDEMGGWNTVTMAEDAEFSAQLAMRGVEVKWVPEAVSYDEQPLHMKQSVAQRLRWCSGIMNVGFLNIKGLVHAAFRKNIFAFDYIMFLVPTFTQAISLLPILFNIVAVFVGPLVMRQSMLLSLLSAAFTAYIGSTLLACLIAYMSGLHDRRIVKSVLTYGVFMFSWVPICFVSLFKKTTVWHEMSHGQTQAKYEVS